jgi:hypothetical protein
MQAPSESPPSRPAEDKIPVADHQDNAKDFYFKDSLF